VAQHETDHLDGVLFFDRMTSMQSLTFSTSTRATTRKATTTARTRTKWLAP
jgi:peptide deformylase